MTASLFRPGLGASQETFAVAWLETVNPGVQHRCMCCGQAYSGQNLESRKPSISTAEVLGSHWQHPGCNCKAGAGEESRETLSFSHTAEVPCTLSCCPSPAGSAGWSLPPRASAPIDSFWTNGSVLSNISSLFFSTRSGRSMLVPKAELAPLCVRSPLCSSARGMISGRHSQAFTNCRNCFLSFFRLQNIGLFS